jgi:hypothetical protein
MRKLLLTILSACVLTHVIGTPALAEDLSVRVCNNASSRIIHIFVTHVDADDWGRDFPR